MAEEGEEEEAEAQGILLAMVAIVITSLRLPMVATVTTISRLLMVAHTCRVQRTGAQGPTNKWPGEATAMDYLREEVIWRVVVQVITILANTRLTIHDSTPININININIININTNTNNSTTKYLHISSDGRFRK